MHIEDRIANEWRSIRLEKLSGITEWRSICDDARRLIPDKNLEDGGNSLDEVGVTIWRARVGRGADWQYARIYYQALSKALDAAETSYK
jgi:hypothetical protein